MKNKSSRWFNVAWQSKIILITTFTCDAERSRLQEWSDCLSINARHSRIDKIVVFLNTLPGVDPEAVFPALKNAKASWIECAGRPMFRRLFDYAAVNHPDACCIIANGDIHFDPDSRIERIREIAREHLWMTSRWEPTDAGEWQNRMSVRNCATYDAFGFLSPLPDFASDIILGKLDCDTYLCQKALAAGIPVLNPSNTIIGKHKDTVTKAEKLSDSSYYIDGGKRYREMVDYYPCNSTIRPVSLPDYAYVIPSNFLMHCKQAFLRVIPSNFLKCCKQALKNNRWVQNLRNKR